MEASSPVVTVFGFARAPSGGSGGFSSSCRFRALRSNLLRQLTDLNVLSREGEGPGAQHRWFAKDALAVLDP